MKNNDPKITNCSKKLAAKLNTNPFSQDAGDLLRSLMVLNSKSSSTR